MTDIADDEIAALVAVGNQYGREWSFFNGDNQQPPTLLSSDRAISNDIDAEDGIRIAGAMNALPRLLAAYTERGKEIERLRAALEPFGDIAAVVEEVVDSYNKAEREHSPEEPFFMPSPSDDLRAHVKFTAYGGPEVGDVELPEFDYDDLMLRDFRRARAALAHKSTEGR